MSTLPQPPLGLPPTLSTQVAPLSLPLRFFRVILWFLPAGFLAVSAWVTGSIDRASYSDLSFWLWVMLNLVFVLTAAWFHAVWSWSARSAPPERQRKARIVQMLIFFFAQIVLMAVLIPLIVIGALFAVCGGMLKN